MIPLSQANNNAVLGRVSVAFYSIAIGMIKISALLFYARLFRTKGRMVMALWIVGVATGIWTIFLVIYPWTFCKPIAKTFRPLLKGVCASRPAWNIASTVINFALDLITLLLPMPVIWKLQMKTKRKLAYLAVFVLGYRYEHRSLLSPPFNAEDGKEATMLKTHTNISPLLPVPHFYPLSASS
jgi:hypothetical protein